MPGHPGLWFALLILAIIVLVLVALQLLGADTTLF